MLASSPRTGAEQPTLAASLSNSIARGTLQSGCEAREAIVFGLEHQSPLWCSDFLTVPQASAIGRAINLLVVCRLLRLMRH